MTIAPAPTRGIVPALAARTDTLTKIFGSGDTAVVAVREVSVQFYQRSLTAIMGPSGSGKSTLMHCLAGLDRPTSGRSYVGDTEITALKDRELTRLRRDRIGFVFQAFNLLPTLTATENITLPLDLAGKKVDKELFSGVVESLGLTDRLKHRPSELSGGQQQRVAIARALITKPDLIFADEPTGALDTSSSRSLLDYLNRAVDDLGSTIVMVTHDPSAAAHADRLLILMDGRIVDDIAAPTQEDALSAMRRLGAASHPPVGDLNV